MPRASATVDPTITTTEKAVFQSDRHLRNNGVDGGGLITAPGDGAPAKGIRFLCTSGSAATLRVRIPGLHNSSQYAFLKAGESRDFIGPGEEHYIDIAYVSTASGTATYNFEVFA